MVASEALARFCKEMGIKRYIFAFSCSIYDVGVEAYEKDIVLDEKAEVVPKVAYSSSKYEAEKRLLSLVDERFCPVILRKGDNLWVFTKDEV